MSLDQIKIDLIQWVSTLEDETVLAELIKIQKEHKSVELSAEELKSIQKGQKDAETNNLVDHSEARKSYEKWL